MKSLVSLLALPLVACTFDMGERAVSGECPAGESCSDATPNGLYFRGATLVGELFADGPAPTAIGGTQAIGLEYERASGTISDLDQPYTADDDGGLGVKVDSVAGSTVTMRGVATRSNYLRILDAADGTLYDRKQLSAGAVSEIGLVPGEWEVRDDASEPVVFATGLQVIGVTLHGDVQIGSSPARVRLVDTAMQLQLAGAIRRAWDTLELEATVGTHALAVTAGDRPAATVDLTVVDHADAITVNAHGDIAVNRSTLICFSARNAGRYIAGLAWSFGTDNGEVDDTGGVFTNCAAFQPDRVGPATVIASAGGQQVTLDLTVQPATTGARSATLPKLPTAQRDGTSAGDRAAM